MRTLRNRDKSSPNKLLNQPAMASKKKKKKPHHQCSMLNPTANKTTKIVSFSKELLWRNSLLFKREKNKEDTICTPTMRPHLKDYAHTIWRAKPIVKVQIIIPSHQRWLNVFWLGKNRRDAFKMGLWLVNVQLHWNTPKMGNNPYIKLRIGLKSLHLTRGLPHPWGCFYVQSSRFNTPPNNILHIHNEFFG